MNNRISSYYDDESLFGGAKPASLLNGDSEKAMQELERRAGIELAWMEKKNGREPTSASQAFLAEQAELLEGHIQELTRLGLRSKRILADPAHDARVQRVCRLEERLHEVRLQLDDLEAHTAVQIESTRGYYLGILHECCVTPPTI